MFIQDAIYSNKRNEPRWFYVLRRTFAITFVIAIFVFGFFYQFDNFLTFKITPNIVTVESKNDSNINFPGFVICPGSAPPAFLYTLNQITEIPQSIPQFSIMCGDPAQIGPEILSDNMNFTSKCSSLFTHEENGCLKFRAENKTSTGLENNNPYYVDDIDTIQTPNNGLLNMFMFFNIKPNTPSFEEDALTPVEMPDFYTIYFDFQQTIENGDFSILNKPDHYVEFNMVTIAVGQKNIVEYSISVHKVYSNSLLGQLNTTPNRLSMEIEANNKIIPGEIIPAGGIAETQLIILPKDLHYNREEIEKYEYRASSIISNLGGFYGFLATFYIALFGMSKLDPWGLFQKIIFRLWPCRRSLKCHLAGGYLTDAGIPFVEDVNKRPKETSLEDRIHILECILKDYYLDGYFLQKLKITKLKYNDNGKMYDKLEELSNTKQKAIENRERVENQNEDDYLMKRVVKRWSNWSRKFGFSNRPKNNNSDFELNSVDSVNSSIPSPKGSRWSNMSFLIFDSSDPSNHDEEMGITSASNPHKFTLQDNRESQDTLIEVKPEK
ncbi:hypothetical protein C1645_829707 [Glomus cerebriforme]|uniref:Uncharacterized protein n=1 Tax=Glomus cerebriforme TaxID=658196 RepID=A0A397STD8_9GLOM|nr:hypothetical protein C1645_829707 [Glomus cerebriforme]